MTSELINEIVFSMEDQNEFYLLDSSVPVLLKKEEVPDFDSDRYYILPVWDSISGFKLMEQFVTVLKNTLVADTPGFGYVEYQNMFLKIILKLKNNGFLSKNKR